MHITRRIKSTDKLLRIAISYRRKASIDKQKSLYLVVACWRECPAVYHQRSCSSSGPEAKSWELFLAVTSETRPLQRPCTTKLYTKTKPVHYMLLMPMQEMNEILLLSLFLALSLQKYGCCWSNPLNDDHC